MVKCITFNVNLEKHSFSVKRRSGYKEPRPFCLSKAPTIIPRLPHRTLFLGAQLENHSSYAILSFYKWAVYWEHEKWPCQQPESAVTKWTKTTHMKCARMRPCCCCVWNKTETRPLHNLNNNKTSPLLTQENAVSLLITPPSPPLIHQPPW